MTGQIQGRGNLREATIAAVVIRADGSTEDLGVISRYHRNPIKRAIWRIKDRLRRR